MTLNSGLQIEIGERTGIMTYDEAKKHCESLAGGWRVPGLSEMSQINSIQNRKVGFTAHFYWTSEEQDSNKAWFLDGAGLHYTGPKTKKCYVWPVRNKM